MTVQKPETPTNAAICEWLYSIEGGTFICAECGECYELGESIPKCPAAANFEKKHAVAEGSNPMTQTAASLPNAAPDREGWGWNGDMCAVWGQAIILGDTRAEMEQRARLFAVAQDMLVALKAMLLNYGPPKGLEGLEYPAGHPITLSRAAIARAEPV